MAEAARKTGLHPARRSSIQSGPADRTLPNQPMFRPDPDAHWIEAEPEDHEHPRLIPRGLKDMTPVFAFSSEQHGAGNSLRTVAYGLPEGESGQRMIPLAAEGVDVVESRIGRALAAPFKLAGFTELGRRVQRNPIPILAAGAAALLLLRVLRPRRTETDIDYFEN